LRAVPNLRKGRCEARESEPVRPVDEAEVEAGLPFRTPTVQAMVRLQRLPGMRPEEVCSLRACDLDRTGEVWLYRPGRHKTQHRGKERAVAIDAKGAGGLAPLPARPLPHCRAEGFPDAIGWKDTLCGPCNDRQEEGKELQEAIPGEPPGGTAFAHKQTTAE
jgi:hypothetical protein